MICNFETAVMLARQLGVEEEANITQCNPVVPVT